MELLIGLLVAIIGALISWPFVGWFGASMIGSGLMLAWALLLMYCVVKDKWLW